MLTVNDLMTRDVFTLRGTDTLKTARSMMSLARIRHIPIVSNSMKFMGLLTHRDILAATLSQFADVDRKTQDEIDSGIPIREIMRTDVTAVTPETPLQEAAELLLHHKYGCLPVVDNDELVGIITEADFLKLTIRLMDMLDLD
ncbi:CBS domain-containing membrane protein [Desulfobaculum xiamenense]|uniref:CBS domain-containing membrane protein n=1 Tax=Desulfobaculum xiamenense TaxID=995050 RepID=A0A846QQF9_9BACT|nr:CBS domain-containing protein [Desulfobaculum xiamenense]NJB66909.1 CBS domain-containing membrane protein [Desulfobaculum xiamenense]